jgi:hypothetical protein
VKGAVGATEALLIALGDMVLIYRLLLSLTLLTNDRSNSIEQLGFKGSSVVIGHGSIRFSGLPRGLRLFS